MIRSVTVYFDYMADSKDLQESLQPSSATVCGADLSSLHPECLTAAVDWEAHRHVISPSSSLGASSPLHSTSSGNDATPSPKRVCFFGCRGVLGGVKHDPHTVCILCRGGVCHVNSRCQECSWSSKLVLRAFKYQRTPVLLERDVDGWTQIDR